MPIINNNIIFIGDLIFSKCILKLKIELKTYENNQKYYYLNYKWVLENNQIKNHLFYDDKDFLENNTEGEIIFQNDLTDMMIKYLMMDEIELSKKTGNIEVMDYKKQIIKAISLFWD